MQTSWRDVRNAIRRLPGVFGLITYQVTQRTRELALRLALGATRANLQRSIMQRGVTLTAVGLALGAIAGFAMPRLVGSMAGGVPFTCFAPASSALSSGSTSLALAGGLCVLSASTPGGTGRADGSTAG